MIIFIPDKDNHLSLMFRRNIKKDYRKSISYKDISNLRRCQKCNSIAFYVRKLNIKLVPQKYILDRNDPCAQAIMELHHIKYSDKYHFITFPKELVLTKYDYYLCDQCYQTRGETCEWNYWKSLN
jgi:hypothetical protein